MRRLLKYVLSFVAVITLVSCQKPWATSKQLTKAKLEKISETYNNTLSQSTYDSYMAFAKKFTSLVIQTSIEKEGEKSLGVSIPDAYFCLAILGAISDDAARSDVLSYLELASVEDMRTAVRELLAVAGTLYKNADGKLMGGYNLNSIWLDPEQVQLVKEKDEQLYQDLEEVFDASTYHNALTSKRANDYMKENGLKDMPVPNIELDDDNPPAIGVMSAYYCLDYFKEETKQRYEQQYKSKVHKMDYTYANNISQVDYIQTREHGNVYEGNGFYGADSQIQNLNMTYFLPNDSNALPSSILNDVLDKNYQLKQGKYIDYEGVEHDSTIFDVIVKAPYFSLDNKIDLEYEKLKTILPVITKKGAGERLAESILGEDLFLAFIKQFSVMKYNYDGFYSCSVTIAGNYASSAASPTYETFELVLDHPYIFEVNKQIRTGQTWNQLPLVIGEIVVPEYED